jgi:hypothetical protein
MNNLRRIFHIDVRDNVTLLTDPQEIIIIARFQSGMDFEHAFLKILLWQRMKKRNEVPRIGTTSTSLSNTRSAMNRNEKKPLSNSVARRMMMMIRHKESSRELVGLAINLKEIKYFPLSWLVRLHFFPAACWTENSSDIFSVAS